MSRAVWKYTIPVDDQDHAFTLGWIAPVLHVASESLDTVSFWIEHLSNGSELERKFRVFGTGHPIPDRAVYVGTVPLPSVGIVWHLYETTACHG